MRWPPFKRFLTGSLARGAISVAALLMLLGLGTAWIVDTLPTPRPQNPSVRPRGRGGMPPTVPPDAAVPWRRDLRNAKPVHVAVAQRAWTRRPTRPMETSVSAAVIPWQRDRGTRAPAALPTAELAWPQRDSQPVELPPAALPWAQRPPASVHLPVAELPNWPAAPATLPATQDASF